MRGAPARRLLSASSTSSILAPGSRAFCGILVLASGSKNNPPLSFRLTTRTMRCQWSRTDCSQLFGNSAIATGNVGAPCSRSGLRCSTMALAWASSTPLLMVMASKGMTSFWPAARTGAEVGDELGDADWQAARLRTSASKHAVDRFAAVDIGLGFVSLGARPVGRSQTPAQLLHISVLTLSL